MTELDKRYIQKVKELEDAGQSVQMAEKLKVTFQNPEPQYYDGKFAT